MSCAKAAAPSEVRSGSSTTTVAPLAATPSGWGPKFCPQRHLFLARGCVSTRFRLRDRGVVLSRSSARSDHSLCTRQVALLDGRIKRLRPGPNHLHPGTLEKPVPSSVPPSARITLVHMGEAPFHPASSRPVCHEASSVHNRAFGRESDHRMHRGHRPPPAMRGLLYFLCVRSVIPSRTQ
jgi:hypothetical protein